MDGLAALRSVTETDLRLPNNPKGAGDDGAGVLSDGVVVGVTGSRLCPDDVWCTVPKSVFINEPDLLVRRGGGLNSAKSNDPILEVSSCSGMRGMVILSIPSEVCKVDVGAAARAGLRVTGLKCPTFARETWS